MRFAVVNADEPAAELAEAWLRSGHELALLCDGEAACLARLRRAAPTTKLADAWEGVLADGTQAVIVGTAGPPERRFDLLRRLAQEGVAAAAVHPAGLAPLEYHEIDMNRQAGRGALVAYCPTRHHPLIELLVGELRDGATGGALGRIQQIVIDRRGPIESHERTMRRFIADTAAAGAFVGGWRKVSAMGTVDAGAAADLGVQITSDDGVLVRWSVGPGADRPGAAMTILAAAGRCTIDMPERGPWSLEVHIGDEAVRDEQRDGGAARHAAPRIAAAVQSADDSLWRAALADMELVEAVERSLRKGRTVELYHEAATEEGTFKGVMAAGGCLLLMLALLLAPAAAIFGPFRLPPADYWPIALLLLLGGFLLLQLLRFVFPTDARERDGE